jgi:hypothetical protein
MTLTTSPSTQPISSTRTTSFDVGLDWRDRAGVDGGFAVAWTVTHTPSVASDNLRRFTRCRRRTPTPRPSGGSDDEAAYARQQRLRALEGFTGDDHCDDVGALRCAALRSTLRIRTSAVGTNNSSI